ncbi:NUDIX domain-containing protein [Candidatus Uhrbacteria bacterium]|nr:NUDIX domain-containing protein [Candidatus Uhrbacteria bacterium]
MPILLTILRPFAAVVFWAMARYQRRYGRLPEWYFFRLPKIAVQTACEVLVMRGDELLLTKRPADDPYWPSQWHFPGTLIRLADDEASIMRRLARELGVDALPSRPVLHATELWTNERGRHLHVFYRMDVPTDATFPEGTFFPLAALPGDMIAYQREQLHRVR